MVALAERLCALSGQDRAFFCNSGAEAVEAAIKLARRVGRARGGPAKHRIVCVEGAFHGRTLATLAAGWSAAKREPFEPVPGRLRARAAQRPRRARARRRPTRPAPCSSSRSRARAASGRSTPPGSSSRASCATATARCSCTTRCRPASAAAAPGSARSSRASGPTRSPSPRASPAAFRSARCWPPTCPMRASSAATTRRRSAARRRSPPPRSRCSTAIEREGLVENARAVGEHISARAGALPGVDHVRGAGLLLGIELTDAPAAEVADALRARGILVNAITPTALRLVPPLCLSQRRGRPLLCHVRGSAGRAPRPACHHSGISSRCARIPVLESCRKRPLTSSFFTYGERCRCLRSPTTPSATWWSLDTMGSRASRTSARLTSMARPPRCSS